MAEPTEDLLPAIVAENGHGADNTELIDAIDLKLDNYDFSEFIAGLSKSMSRKKPSDTGPNNSSRLKNDLMKIATDQVENFRKYRTLGNKIFDGVAKLIKQNSNVKISRQLIAGSMGKNSSLGYSFEPDYDVVFFVRGRHTTDLPEVRGEIFWVLKENLPSKFKEWTGTNFRNRFLQNLKHTIMLKFPIDLGTKKVQIKFDLLLAYSFSENVDAQTELTLEEIGRCENPTRDWHFYSSSLSERTVQFVREQSQFTQYVIRLAKLWGKNVVPPGKYISGLSYIMELVAIKAAQEADTNILTAYRRFLEYMEKFNEIRIRFCDFHPNYKHSIPFILDSINPYNNYAEAIARKPAFCNAFKTRAAETLKALEECEVTKNYKAQLDMVLSFFATAGFTSYGN